MILGLERGTTIAVKQRFFKNLIQYFFLSSISSEEKMTSSRAIIIAEVQEQPKKVFVQE